MKFTSTALLALAASSVTQAFTPKAPVVRTTVAAPTSSLILAPTSTALAGQGILDGTAHSDVAHLNTEMPPKISEGQVRALFYLWNDALATGDPRLVTKRYTPDAVLLPTVSDTPRTDHEGILDYFTNFLQLEPQGIILDGKVKIGNGWAKDVGIYEFTMGATGARVKARYTYVYEYCDGQWKIAHHHSSQMPEVKPNVQEITEPQVKNLFHLWNDALDTLDSDLVAKRYAKNAVLLPTVSDTPRTDYATIKDYFDNFLKLQPQGKILESHVCIGDNWCNDVGIYEFTMGASGDVVRARYSFVYVYEDGQWKISHHHSSQMPEGMTNKGSADAPMLSDSEIQDLFYLWNDALATLDSSQVAARYAKQAVLLPTVSDQPRTTQATISDYFDAFLLKQPQGVILESHVTSGPGWCKDVGIYEFTMGADGSSVKARYSFVYVYEDDEWKISHHHSSVMPEALLGYTKEDEITTVNGEAVAA